MHINRACAKSFYFSLLTLWLHLGDACQAEVSRSVHMIVLHSILVPRFAIQLSITELSRIMNRGRLAHDDPANFRKIRRETEMNRYNP